MTAAVNTQLNGPGIPCVCWYCENEFAALGATDQPLEPPVAAVEPMRGMQARFGRQP